MRLRNQIPIALGLLMSALASGPASAVTVAYETQGSFSPAQSPILTFGCELDPACFSDGHVAYSDSDTVAPGMPANDTLGWFHVLNRNYTTPAPPADFVLTITEAMPSKGSDALQAQLSGTISRGNGGGLFLTFPKLAVTIGTETYQLTGVNGTNTFAIRNHGPTELDAIITTTSTAPEPTCYLLTGSGLMAMAMRRRKQRT